MLTIPVEWNVREVWAMQPLDDVAPAFAAFVYYRELGPERHLRDVAKATGRRMSTLTRWAAEFLWLPRAVAWDRRATAQHVICEVMPAKPEECMDRIIGKGERVAELIFDEYLDRASRNIPLEATPREAAFVAETMEKLKRLRAGQATEIVEEHRPFSPRDVWAMAVELWPLGLPPSAPDRDLTADELGALWRATREEP